MKERKGVVVIGAGIGGMATAIKLAKAGFDVTILEKNSSAGGRARTLTEAGYTFDMGPSWYMMPDVFKDFFASVGKNIDDYYTSVQLDPSYSIFFGDGKRTDISSDLEKNKKLFDSIEPGSGAMLERYLEDCKKKYDLALGKYIRNSYQSIFELFSFDIIKSALTLDLLGSYHSEVKKYFKNPKLQQIMEWEVTFIGCSPHNAPALYSLMGHAAMTLGIWYPKNGLGGLVEGFFKLSEEFGVKYRFNSPVTAIEVTDNKVSEVKTADGVMQCDVVVSNADYAFTESLLPDKFVQFGQSYWKKAVQSPSCFLLYIGVNTKLPNLVHHNYFFDEDWDTHFDSVFNNHSWPDKPEMYVCAASKTDTNIAPSGCENLFVLIPVAAGLKTTKEIEKKYTRFALDKIKKYTGVDISDKIDFIRSYSIEDFITDYNAYKGNAFGLANTLFQTAIFRPNNKSSKLSNLYFSGCNTNPGVGLPTSLISGEITSELIINEHT